MSSSTIGVVVRACECGGALIEGKTDGFDASSFVPRVPKQHTGALKVEVTGADCLCCASCERVTLSEEVKAEIIDVLTTAIAASGRSQIIVMGMWIEWRIGEERPW